MQHLIRVNTVCSGLFVLTQRKYGSQDLRADLKYCLGTLNETVLAVNEFLFPASGDQSLWYLPFFEVRKYTFLYLKDSKLLQFWNCFRTNITKLFKNIYGTISTRTFLEQFSGTILEQLGHRFLTISYSGTILELCKNGCSSFRTVLEQENFMNSSRMVQDFFARVSFGNNT